jgi:hypothetical protein
VEEGVVSATKWSPEPWSGEIDGDYPGPSFWLRDANDMFVGESDSEPDMRRIVACVNACAGLPTEALEAGALGKAIEAAGRMLRVVNAVTTAEIDAESALYDALGALGRLP